MRLNPKAMPKTDLVEVEKYVKETLVEKMLAEKE